MKSLKDVYAPYFKIGAAVNRQTVKSHEALLKQHFNSLTCENEMKYGSMYNDDGSQNTSGADEIYDFAEANGIPMRGHTLVWHNQTPESIFAENDRTLTLTRLAEHMIFMANRYGSNTYAWDIVNEAIEDKEDVFLRKTKWLELLGEDYLPEVFRMAYDFFSTQTLYYNDYNEANPQKRAKIIRLVKELLEQGVPIKGVGLQAHHNIYSPAADEIKESMELYAALGVKVSITEMDVSMFRFDDHSSVPAPTAEMIERQAAYYGQCFKIFREYSEHIESVTFWGVADDVTWLDHFPAFGRKNWPLLFDEKHMPKEAFLRVVDF